MKVEVARHGRGFGNRGSREVIHGSLAAAFEVEIGLGGVNGAEEGAVAGNIDSGVGGQAVIGKGTGLTSIVGDPVAVDTCRCSSHINGQAGPSGNMDFGRRIPGLWLAAAATD